MNSYLTIGEMVKACNGIYYGSEEALLKRASGVVLDSRKVEPGVVFLAAKGERVDGHDFIDQAVNHKAAAVIGEWEPQEWGIPYIKVTNSFVALKEIAKFYREHLALFVIGITGSVGKTSTKEFIASVLSQKYNVLKTEGNFNNEIGLPLTVLKIQKEHEVAVLEMGISDFGEMHRLSSIAKPDICVLTNIGQCHLEFLKSREGILKAKTEIFDFMSENGSVCVNADDDMLAGIKEVKGKKPVTFGLSDQNDVYADSILDQGLYGSDAVLHLYGDTIAVHIPLPGSHMVYNALCAAAVGNLMGLKKEQIKAGIETVSPVGGRSHVMKCGRLTIIDDCYNANPVSMKAAIDLLATHKGHKTAIVGDMFELGENEIPMHDNIGEYAVQKGINTLFCVGALAKHIYEGALREAKMIQQPTDILYFPTKEELLKSLQGWTKEAAVLVKASHGMHLEEVVAFLKCIS